MTENPDKDPMVETTFKEAVTANETKCEPGRGSRELQRGFAATNSELLKSGIV
jgi:hypothetical protein